MKRAGQNEVTCLNVGQTLPYEIVPLTDWLEALSKVCHMKSYKHMVM